MLPAATPGRADPADKRRVGEVDPFTRPPGCSRWGARSDRFRGGCRPNQPRLTGALRSRL